MSSPGKTAVISGIGILLIGYSILSADEASSTALATLQYVLLALAVIGLVGSLVRMGR
jgi:preprotein translocase subunit Sss1